jgi:hypothetical protein
VSIEGRDALQRVVTGLREEHRACRHGTTVCNLGGCPWPVMFDEDVNELHQKLTEAGYEITRRGDAEEETQVPTVALPDAQDGPAVAAPAQEEGHAAR